MPEITVERILEMMEAAGQDIDVFLQNSYTSLVDSRTGKPKNPCAMFAIEAGAYTAACTIEEAAQLLNTQCQRRINEQTAVRDAARPVGCHPGPAPIEERDQFIKALVPSGLCTFSRMKARADRQECLRRFNIAAPTQIRDAAVEDGLGFTKAHAEGQQVADLIAKHKHLDPRNWMSAGQLSAIGEQAASRSSDKSQIVNFRDGLFFGWATEAAAVIELDSMSDAEAECQLQLHVRDAHGWPAFVRIANLKRQSAQVRLPSIMNARVYLPKHALANHGFVADVPSHGIVSFASQFSVPAVLKHLCRNS